MENIVEVTVSVPKTKKDKFIQIAVITLAIIISVPLYFMNSILALAPIVSLVLGFLAYRIAISKNVDFDYELVGDSIDISRVINKSKRKSIYKAALSDFDLVAKIDSSHYTENIKEIPNEIKAVYTMDKANIYFGVTEYKSKKTVVYMECNPKMLAHIKKQIEFKMKA